MILCIGSLKLYTVIINEGFSASHHTLWSFCSRRFVSSCHFFAAVPLVSLDLREPSRLIVEKCLTKSIACFVNNLNHKHLAVPLPPWPTECCADAPPWATAHWLRTAVINNINYSRRKGQYIISFKKKDAVIF